MSNQQNDILRVVLVVLNLCLIGLGVMVNERLDYMQTQIDGLIEQQFQRDRDIIEFYKKYDLILKNNSAFLKIPPSGTIPQ